MQTITERPEPSSEHATCAWCAAQFSTVIELIDHVDERHLADKRDIQSPGTVGANTRGGRRRSGRDASHHQLLRCTRPASTRRMGWRCLRSGGSAGRKDEGRRRTRTILRKSWGKT